MNRYAKFVFMKYYLYTGIAKLRLNDKSIAPRYYVNGGLGAEKILGKDNEESVLNTFLSKIKVGDIVFDIGANIGLYTLPAALKLRGTGKVIAFEPVPMWFNRLKNNLSLNSIENVFMYNVGLYTKTEEREMSMKNIQGSGMASIATDYKDEIPESLLEKVRVRLVKGDCFVSENKIPLPNLIKIDVEGAELEAIEGLENTIRQADCKSILCEVHPRYMKESPTAIDSILTGLGYRIEKIDERRSEYFILASKNID